MKSRLARYMVVLLIFLVIIVIYLQMNKGSLEGDVVFQTPPGEKAPTVEGTRVFLLSASIGQVLDTLNIHYDSKVAFLEDTVTQIRQQIKKYRDIIREEEALFKISYGGRIIDSPQYRKNRQYLENLKAQHDSLDGEYSSKRERLVTQQSGYNGVIAGLLIDKVVLHTETDEKGHFIFPKVPQGAYYIYALRIMAGNEDITGQPSGAYYKHALSGDKVRKFSWLQKISVKKDSYIRLDASNMTDVYK